MILRLTATILLIGFPALVRAEGARLPSQTGLTPIDKDSDIPTEKELEDYGKVFTIESVSDGENWKTSPSYARYGSVASYTDDLGLQNLLRGFERLKDGLGESAAFDTANGPQLRERLVGELDAVIKKLAELADEKQVLEWKDLVDWEIVTNRFEPTSEKWPEIETKSDSVFFADPAEDGGSRQVQFDTFKYEGPLETVVAESSRYYATIEQAIEFRAVTSRVTAMFGQLKEEPYERVQLRLRDINAGWTNYLEKGYSQYPWESYLNSYLAPRIFGLGRFSWSDPPSNQLVFAHPEPGLLLDIRQSGNASVEPALLIHGLGIIHYFGEKRGFFLGASGTASISANSDFGFGGGATLHFGHSSLAEQIPHVTISLLWHDFDQGSNGPIVGVNVDLWRLLSQSGGEEVFQSSLR